MTFAKHLNDKLKKLDKVQADTLDESRALLREAKHRHNRATDKISGLAKKKKLSAREKKEYAELIIIRQEAEKAAGLLSATLEQAEE